MTEIRRVTTAQWELLRDARLEALADAPYAFGSTLAEEEVFDEAEWRNRANTFVWFVAVENAAIVGLVAGASFSPPPARDIISMWTSATARGTGTADALVGAVIDWAERDGATELLLWVSDGNDRARRFYERLGFVATGNRKPLRSNPTVGEAEMRLVLRG